MARLGNIEIFNINENYKNNVEITEYSVEKGVPFSDHVRQTNPDLAVSGFIFGENWETTIDEIRSLMNKGTMLKYVGKYTAEDVLIESFTINADKSVSNGTEISLVLRKVRVTKSSYVKAPKNTISQRKAVTTEGEKKQTGPRATPDQTFHTIIKGDTYWYCSKKYGVSVDWLIKHNPWEPTKLPIGSKMRVS